MSICEAVMLFCFGAAWLFFLYRSYRSRTNAGKSLTYLSVVLAGYISGILHKVFFRLDPIIFLSVINWVDGFRRHSPVSAQPQARGVV